MDVEYFLCERIWWKIQQVSFEFEIEVWKRRDSKSPFAKHEIEKLCFPHKEMKKLVCLCACVRVCMCWEYSCESERMESWGYLRIFLFNWEKLKSSEKENFQFHESCILLWVSRSPVKAHHHHRRSHTLPLFFLLSKMVFHLNIHE